MSSTIIKLRRNATTSLEDIEKELKERSFLRSHVLRAGRAKYYGERGWKSASSNLE